MNEFVVYRNLIRDQYLAYCREVNTTPLDMDNPVEIDRRRYHGEHRGNLCFWCNNKSGTHLVPAYCIQDAPQPAPEWKENMHRVGELIDKARSEKTAMRYVEAFEAATKAWKMLKAHSDKDIARAELDTRKNIRQEIRTLKPLMRKDMAMRDLQARHDRLLELTQKLLQQGSGMPVDEYAELVQLVERGQQ